MKKIVFTLTIILSTFLIQAQIVNPTKWSFNSKQDGNNFDLIFEATIDKGWHLYDTDLPDGGPIATTFVYEDSTLFEFVGDIQKDPVPEIHFDETFQLYVGYFGGKATLTQKIKLKTSDAIEIKGYVLFMSCNDETCTPPEEAEFSFKFNQDSVSEVVKEEAAAVKTEPEDPNRENKHFGCFC